MNQSTLADAAATVRRLLDAVERDELDAPGERGQALIMHLEGAATAWEVAAGKGSAALPRS